MAKSSASSSADLEYDGGNASAKYYDNTTVTISAENKTHEGGQF